MSEPPRDPVEDQILVNLGKLAGGFNPRYGRAISLGDQMAASQRYLALKAAADQRRLAWKAQQDAARLQEEAQQHTRDEAEGRLQLDVARLQIEAQNESRRLDIEADKVEVQKAEVIVRALEAAARHPQLELLTQVVSEMSYKLLGGGVLPALEDNQKDA